jgi:hypothetical protein
MLQKILFFINAMWVSKRVEFYADFESVEKIAKRLVRKKFSAKK